MKQFIRNFNKQKIVGLLNISSLSLGIMVSVLVGLWAINELTFDNFHRNGDRIYRSLLEFNVNNVKTTAVFSHRSTGETALGRIPEIGEICRIDYGTDEQMVINDHKYTDNSYIVADYNFFTFFNFPLKEGDAKTSFSAPDNVIIDETTALKYFPDGAMGKQIAIDDQGNHLFTVSGIMYDMPRNSHIQVNMVFPFFGKWQYYDFDIINTYYLLRDGADIGSLQNQITEIVYEAYPYYKGPNAKVLVEPLKDIHFGADDIMWDRAKKGNKSTVLIFLWTSVLILLISCINFINLFISTSFIRAKAIGIKKSQGASKLDLISSFYRETLIYVLISLIAGFLLALLMLPSFNRAVNADLHIDFASPFLYLFLIGLAVFITIMAGSFPALYMTRFGIIETLREKFKGKRTSYFQEGLTVVQFAASMFLLIVVLFFGRQIDYILSQDLGFDKDNIIVVEWRDDLGGNYDSFRDEMLKHPTITDITARYRNITGLAVGAPISREKSGEQTVAERNMVKANYFDFMGMEIIAGENPFLLESSSARRYCVINETLAKFLNIGDDPVDKTFYAQIPDGEGQWTIKGVVRDMYTRSFHQPVDPQVYFEFTDLWDNNVFYFKITGDPRESIMVIEDKWKQSFGEIPFSYRFLDQDYEALYSRETNSRNVLSYALIITFIITAAGLFAMAFYSAQQRTKEIGIRKINGATISQLMILLNKSILKWVIIAFAIACAASYFLLVDWLDSFTVKTPLSAWVFILAGVVTCCIALLTVSYQTWKAASANPVDSLKSE